MAERTSQTIVGMSKPMAYKGDGDVDYMYIPARTLAGKERMRKSLFILPDHQETREYVSQLDEIRTKLQVRTAGEPNPIYIPPTDEILDIAIKEHVSIMQEALSRNTDYILSPYSHTAENEEWMKILQDAGYTIEANIAQKSEDLYSLDNRGGWARHVADPGFVPHPERVGIPYPTAWIGTTLDETVEAYERVVQQTNNPKVQFKGVHSAGGFVNLTAHSPEEVAAAYARFAEAGALGESGAVEMQAFIEGLGRIMSFQYSTTPSGIHVIDTPGHISEQILHESNWQGNKFNDPRLVQQHSVDTQQIFKRVSAVLNGTMAKGGLDIGETPSGLVVIEHNAKRMTGAHPAVELMQALGVPAEMPAVSKKCQQEIRCDVKTLWDVLEKEGLSFDPISKTGIFPICWMNGYYGMLMAFGPVEKADILERQIDQVYNHLAQLGYVS